MSIKEDIDLITSFLGGGIGAFGGKYYDAAIRIERELKRLQASQVPAPYRCEACKDTGTIFHSCSDIYCEGVELDCSYCKC